MPVPLRYRDKQEKNIISYSYTDLAEGTGVVAFYAGGLADSSGSKYHLSSNQFACSHTGYSASGSGTFASEREARFSSGSTTYVTCHDLDFDTSTFNTSRVLRGTLLCNVAYGFQPTLSSTSVTTKCTVTIYYVDPSSVATQIATGTSSEHSIAGGVGATQGLFSFNLTIPKTPIPKGYKIRINVLIEGKGSNANGWGLIFGFDPMGNELKQVQSNGNAKEILHIDAGYSSTKFFIPFNIDV